MSRPIRTASLVASQRISSLLRPKSSSRANSVMGDSVCEVIHEEEWTNCEKFSPFLPDPLIPTNSPRIPPISIPSPKENNPHTYAPKADSYVPSNDFLSNNVSGDNRFTEYMGTKHYIRMMLRRTQASSNPEDNTAITIKIFEHLVAHPTILIYEPRFRETVVGKIKEFENTIFTQTHSPDLQELEDTFWKLKSTAYSLIKHSQLRNKINSHLTDIIQVYQEYRSYLNRHELVGIIDILKQILLDIQKHPKYVA
jgi:hypothetical protein